MNGVYHISLQHSLYISAYLHCSYYYRKTPFLFTSKIQNKKPPSNLSMTKALQTTLSRSSFGSARQCSCIRLSLLCSAKPADQFRMFPFFYGSNPYPCSNLTYRGFIQLHFYDMLIFILCQSFTS